MTEAELALNGIYIGDCLGLPYEGLSSKQIQMLKPNIFKSPWIHNAWFFSDDTEHASFTLKALIQTKDLASFKRHLLKEFRCWFLTLPVGIGLATMKAGFKSLVFFLPTGVKSQGNGPLMRATVIGAFFHDCDDERKKYIHASTTMTHSDPVADEVAQWVGKIAASIVKYPEKSKKDHFEKFDGQIPLSRSPGWCIESKNICRYSFVESEGDLKRAMEIVIRLGGDTDTNAAIVASWCKLLKSNHQSLSEFDVPHVTFSKLLFIHIIQLLCFLPWMFRRRLPLALLKR
jgi:ADP-ribosyl-[dinitrogen reductase] hydrolase